MVKNDPKVIKSWLMFDWANSVYALVISTAVFPIYFTQVTDDIITIFGYEVLNASLYSFAVTMSYIIIASLSPLLSGVADASGRRLYFLKIFSTMGALACMSMFFFKSSGDVWIGIISFIVATIGFSGSLVFYDSFLPLIASEDKYDRISAKGFSYGYVGSVILLLVILIMIQKPELFGMLKGTLPSRIGFLLVGMWWLGFSQITFKGMPKDNKIELTDGYLKRGYQEISKVIDKAKQLPNLKRFLLSFFCYSAGVQTTIYVASIFGEQELKMETSELITTILLIQLVGIVGAYSFSRLSEKFGNKVSLMLQITIWMLICISAYFCNTKIQFYMIAIAVGMVMGGIQALSRASYAKLLPEDTIDFTSYYSLYDVTYKLAIVFGTLSFGIINQITGSMRNSVIALGVYFVIGLIIMSRVTFRQKSHSQFLGASITN